MGCDGDGVRHGMAKMRTALASICLSLLVALSGALAGSEGIAHEADILHVVEPSSAASGEAGCHAIARCQALAPGEALFLQTDWRLAQRLDRPTRADLPPGITVSFTPPPPRS